MHDAERRNKDRYGGLKAKLENAQLLRRDEFPKTREDLMGILNNFKGPLLMAPVLMKCSISKGGTIKYMEELQEDMEPQTFKTLSADVRKSFVMCMMLSGATSIATAA